MDKIGENRFIFRGLVARGGLSLNVKDYDNRAAVLGFEDTPEKVIEIGVGGSFSVSAANVTYDNTSTNLTSTTVQTAITELNNKIENIGDVKVTANLTTRNALVGIDVGDLVHVLNDGDGKWARYQAIGIGPTVWVKIADQDQFSSTVDFLGSTNLANGATGFVPAPLIADRRKYLKGDGSWSSLLYKKAGDPTSTDDVSSGFYIDALLFNSIKKYIMGLYRRNKWCCGLEKNEWRWYW